MKVVLAVRTTLVSILERPCVQPGRKPHPRAFTFGLRTCSRLRDAFDPQTIPKAQLVANRAELVVDGM